MRCGPPESAEPSLLPSPVWGEQAAATERTGDLLHRGSPSWLRPLTGVRVVHDQRRAQAPCRRLQAPTGGQRPCYGQTGWCRGKQVETITLDVTDKVNIGDESSVAQWTEGGVGTVHRRLGILEGE